MFFIAEFSIKNRYQKNSFLSIDFFRCGPKLTCVTVLPQRSFNPSLIWLSSCHLESIHFCMHLCLNDSVKQFGILLPVGLGVLNGNTPEPEPLSVISQKSVDPHHFGITFSRLQPMDLRLLLQQQIIILKVSIIIPIPRMVPI